MSTQTTITDPIAVIDLGCDPVVTLTLKETGGRLVGSLVSDQPIDIDALFFNFAEGATTAPVALISEDQAAGYTFGGLASEATTATTDTENGIDSLSNGVQLQDGYDVRIEFGTPSETEVGQTALDFSIDGGDYDLDLDEIDLSSALVAVNTSCPDAKALTASPTGGAGGETALVPVTVTEDFEDIHDPDDSALIASDDRWDVRHDQLFTNGHRDGELRFEAVETADGAALSFDARGDNLHAFEATGHAADSLRVEARLDGGDWVLLDDFVVNHDGSALVGSETGQQITEDSSNVTYDGLFPGEAGTVEFRFVSDISAGNERIQIDDVAITVSDAADSDGGDAAPVVLQAADFDDVHDADDEDAVAKDAHWEVVDGAAFTNGRNDGALELEEVETDGPVTLTFDAKANGLSNFESDGRHADSREVQVKIDGGHWITLDTFTVNENGTALVGSETGQTITEDSATLTYEGGVLDTAQDDVEFRFDSDISAHNEQIFIDNISVAAAGDDTGSDPAGKVDEGFEDAEAGDTVADQFDGFSVVGQRAGDHPDSENDAMIFDTDNPTGGDDDLAYDDQGNAIIISEDNDADDPDDEAHGGTLEFTFETVSTVDSLTVLDVEDEGGSIDLFDADGALLNSVPIPGAGDNSAQDLAIDTAGVSTMLVTFVGSGAVDDLHYTPEDPDDAPTPDCDLQYALDPDSDADCPLEDDMMVA